jgi:hypothetical protein
MDLTMRGIFESFQEAHEDRLEELLDAARLDALSLGTVSDDITTMLDSSAADQFLSSFNPALTGYDP